MALEDCGEVMPWRYTQAGGLLVASASAAASGSRCFFSAMAALLTVARKVEPGRA